MDNGEHSIGFLLNDVARLLRQNFNRRAVDLKLSQSQWRTLAYLSRQQGVNQITLAKSLEIQPITLARLIDRLEEAGLVERRPDSSDRRAFRLYLTQKAQPLIKKMQAIAKTTREDAMAGMSAAQQEALFDSLNHMKSKLLEAECGYALSDKSSEKVPGNVPGKQ